MVSRIKRKEIGNHHFKPLGRPSNLTDEMEKEICEKMLKGISNNKLLQNYPVGLKTIKEIKLKRMYFLDLP